METVQVLKGTSATIRGLFYSGGVLTDTDSTPTATLTKPDGTAGPASGTISHPATGTYSFVLAATSTTECTRYTVTWSGSIGTQPQTLTLMVEVVGNLLYTLAEAKAWDGGAIPAAGVSDDAILQMRVLLTNDLERRCNVSFLPRFTRETHSAGRGDIRLYRRRAGSLLSVTVNGTASQLDGYWLDPSGILRPRNATSFLPGTPIRFGLGNVTVEYVHGWDQVPPPVSQAALRITRALLVPSNIGDRATSITSDAGTILLATAGRGQFQPYGLPLADSVLAAYFESLAA